ncbi:MAG TPA: hypothetical protein VFR18_27945 [Terriglobia bacterium]|nr:hypothetical protein [Terriglobia bacterium]
MRRKSISLALLASVVTAFVLLSGQSAAAADLNLFKRYYGTMDFVVKGTSGIRGTGTLDPRTGQSRTEALIDLSTLPASVDIVAAFLYWQGFEKSAKPSLSHAWISYTNTPAAFASPVPPGHPNYQNYLNYLAYVGEEALGKPLGNDNAANCGSNGGSTGSNLGAHTVRTYRADVRRYLEVPGTGERPQKIWFRGLDSGSGGNGAPLIEGASLLLVLRHPAYSFKYIGIFDGSQALDGSNDLLSLDMNGFYQAVPGEQKVNLMVGNGQSNFSEILKFNDKTLAVNPFVNGWDDATYPVPLAQFPLTQPPDEFGEKVNITITHGQGSFDCVAVAAGVFSTTVPDGDKDGLLDPWEGPAGFKDITTGDTINLAQWGANPLIKDLFVEIDYMEETKNDVFGKPHTHRIKTKAVYMVVEAFRRQGIQVHVDAGDPAILEDGGTLFPGGPTLKSYLLATNTLISTGFEGGDRLDERWPAFFCATATGTRAGCLFPGQPGLITWRKGIQRIKNNFFNEARDFIFHYGVFGHALAIKGNPLAGGGFEAKSISGRSDLPGNTFAVTLGKWKSSVAADLGGTAENQASTFLHELAHNLWGIHGRFDLPTPLTINDPIVPVPNSNCNPNKQSSLNYVYQPNGLIDGLGAYTVDLSGEVLTGFLTTSQNEIGLKELDGLKDDAPAIAYRLRYYAPLENVKSQFLSKGKVTPPALTEAKAYCGTGILVPNSGMIRVDGLGYAGDPLSVVAVDWNYDRAFNTLSTFHDINFNGIQDVTADFTGFNDWAAIARLAGYQQVGSGRNIYGLSLGVKAEDLLRLGEDDLGEDDLGEDDLGEDDLGEDDLGEDDLGEDDLGEDDLGEDDLGEISELDEATAINNGVAGPTGLTGKAETGPLRIVLTWSAPAYGGAMQSYTVYRRTGTDPFEEIGQSAASPFEDTRTRSGVVYSYLVIGKFAEGGVLTPQSNIVNVTQ